MQLVTCVRRLGGWTRAWWVGAAVAAGVGVPATAPAQTPPAAWGPLLLPSGREQQIDSFFGRGVDISNDGGTIAVTSDYRVGPASDPWLYGLTIYTRTDADMRANRRSGWGRTRTRTGSSRSSSSAATGGRWCSRAGLKRTWTAR
ncbi:MAG: hypothetical protein K2Q09_10705 [Phycisphaerales bacterium]|nr:hypothetical protein [Phycisphaerales bacterium]